MQAPQRGYISLHLAMHAEEWCSLSFTGSSPLGPGNRAQSALSCVAKLCVVLQNAVIEFSRCQCAKGIDDLRSLIAPSA